MNTTTNQSIPPVWIWWLGCLVHLISEVELNIITCIVSDHSTMAVAVCSLLVFWVTLPIAGSHTIMVGSVARRHVPIHQVMLGWHVPTHLLLTCASLVQTHTQHLGLLVCFIVLYLNDFGQYDYMFCSVHTFGFSQCWMFVLVNKS